MSIGLIGYFIMLLTEKADWKMKVTQVVVFTALGVVGGMVWMNAQHGVRYFLGRPGAPFIEANESMPELFIVAIGLLGARKRVGWQVGVVASIVALAAVLAFIDRAAVTQEWLRGALLSGGLLVPFFKNRLIGELPAQGPKPTTAPRAAAARA